MKPDDLKTNAASVLGETPAAEACFQLIDALLSLEPSDGAFLTFTSFQNLIGKTEVDAALVSAVQFLTSSKNCLLAAHGQLVDLNGREFTLESDAFEQVLHYGSLVHPLSGEDLPDARSMVFPFFVLSVPDELERVI